jgi:hypothetical protein
MRPVNKSIWRGSCRIGHPYTQPQRMEADSNTKKKPATYPCQCTQEHATNLSGEAPQGRSQAAIGSCLKNTVRTTAMREQCSVHRLKKNQQESQPAGKRAHRTVTLVCNAILQQRASAGECQHETSPANKDANTATPANANVGHIHPEWS